MNLAAKQLPNLTGKMRSEALEIMNDQGADKDICFWVGEVTLKQFNEDPLPVLSHLSYLFQLDRQTLETSDLNSGGYYFSLEGDIALKAICQNYKIFQEIQSLPR